MAYDRPSSTLSSDLIENWLSALELLGTFGIGRGVLDGLALSDGGGLVLNVSAGTLFGTSAVEFEDATTVALTGSVTRYIWRDESGNFTQTTTIADPGGTYVCLGKVVTGVSSITSISTTGRMSCWRNTALRVWQLGQGLIYADQETNRVGIRQTTPLYPLDVSVGDDTGLARVDDLLLKQISATPSTVASHFQFYCRSGNLYALTPGGTEVLIVDGSSASLGAPTTLDQKLSVRIATTTTLPANTRSGNILTATANGAFAAVDGVTLALNERILVKDEATGANNGIYYLSQVGDGSNPWKLTRATDADVSAEVTSGMMVPVSEGTLNADTLWFLSTNDTITLNTTSLTFVEVAATLAMLAGSGLGVSGNGLIVNVDGVGIEISADTLQLKDGGVTNAKLRNSAALSVIGRAANSSGVPADIAASAASDAVLRESGSTIGFGTIATAGIAAGAVTEAKIGLSDNTTNDASASNHGFLKKLSGNAYDVMGGDGNWKPMLLLLASNRGSVTGGALAAGTTRYCSPMSAVLYELTQANAEIKIPRAGRIKYLRLYASANAITVGTATAKVMINGSVVSTPNLSFNSGSGTGWFADDSTEINVSAGDLITVELIGATTGSITFTGLEVGLMES